MTNSSFDMPPSNFTISHEVSRALNLSLPIVALESAVITHGLPHPHNLTLARDMESRVREEGATPATIAVLEGAIRIGLSEPELTQLADAGDVMKISQRDFATAITQGASGGTTVAGTMFAAHAAGIQVFATGGIGGVHKEARFDVSTDLHALASIPMIVVCAGAKAILDLPSTLEYLESMAVPVVGYQSEDFPAFYSRQSGLKVNVSVASPEEVVEFAQAHWGIGMRSAVLVTQPIQADDEIPKQQMDPLIARASQEAIEKKIQGQELTPYLLSRLNELSNGRTLRANLALLLNNATLAAQIARAMARKHRQKVI